MWDVDKQSDSVLTKATFVFLELPVPMLLCVVRSVGSTIETFPSIVVQRTSYLHSWNLMKSHLTTDNMISVERPPNGGNERHAPGLSIKRNRHEAFAPILTGQGKGTFLGCIFVNSTELGIWTKDIHFLNFLNIVSWSIPEYCCTGHQVYLKFNKWGRTSLNQTCRLQLGYSWVTVGERGWVPSTFQHICQFVAGLKSGVHHQASPNDAWISVAWPRILGARLGRDNKSKGSWRIWWATRWKIVGWRGGDRVDPSLSRCLDVAWSKMSGGGEGSAWTRTIFVKDLGSRTVRTPVGCFVFIFMLMF